MAKTVFISYRRQDTAPAAGRVYDRLCHLLSRNNVFLDVTTIGGGEDFVTKMTAAIRQSDSILVFIGKKWAEPNPEGVVRIRQPNDHVRSEIRVALSQTKMVLPVLVDGAVMPRPDQLPEDIRALTTINGLPLRHESFDDDIETIITTILGKPTKERLWDDRGKLSAKIGYSFAGLLAALALWVACGLLYFWVVGRFLAETIGNGANAILLLTTVAAGAWLGFLYEARRRKRRLQGLA